MKSGYVTKSYKVMVNPYKIVCNWFHLLSIHRNLHCHNAQLISLPGINKTESNTKLSQTNSLC